jgi:hypothetical protein
MPHVVLRVSDKEMARSRVSVLDLSLAISKHFNTVVENHFDHMAMSHKFVVSDNAIRQFERDHPDSRDFVQVVSVPSGTGGVVRFPLNMPLSLERVTGDFPKESFHSGKPAAPTRSTKLLLL